MKPRYELIPEGPSSRYEILDESSASPQESFIDKLPFPIKQAVKLGLDESTIPQRVAAIGRGFSDIGEGAKQMYLEGKEKLGFSPPGTANDYTKQTQDERNFYQNQMPNSQQPIPQLLREGASSLPFLLAGGPAFGAESTLAKMGWGAAGLGAVKGAEFVPQGQSRLGNIAQGAAIGGALPLIPEVPGAIEKSYDFLKKTFPFKKAFQDTEPLENALSKAEEQYNKDKSESDLAKGNANAAGVSSNPNIAQYRLDTLKNKLQNTYEQLGEKSPVSPQDIEEHENNMDLISKLHTEAEKSTNQAKNNFSTLLNENAAHDVRTAARIDKLQDEKRKQISKGYDELEKDFEKREVKIDNSGDIKNKTQQLFDLIKNNEGRSSEANTLLDDLDRLKSEDSINAKDFLRNYRSVSQYAREARTKAYTPGMNAEERQMWQKTYNDLDAKVDEMGQALELGVGGEDFLRLNQLNDRWKKEVVPLYKNTIYQNIRKKGQMPPNIAKSLRGTDPGNILMKNIIKKDPEALLNVIGQRYAVNPNEIHSPNENMMEYLDRVPEVHEMNDILKNSTNYQKEIKDLLGEYTNQHKDLLKNYEEHQSQQHEAQKLNDDIQHIEKNIEELRKTAARKNLSLKEKVVAESNLKKMLSEKKIARRKLLITGGIISTPILGNKVWQLLKSNNEGEK